jgi:hypothetical protein
MAISLHCFLLDGFFLALALGLTFSNLTHVYTQCRYILNKSNVYFTLVFLFFMCYSLNLTGHHDTAVGLNLNELIHEDVDINLDGYDTCAFDVQ